MTEVRLAGIRVRCSITIFPLALVVYHGGQAGGTKRDRVAVHAGVGLHNGLGKRRQADQGQGLPLLFAAHRGEVIGIPVQREGQSGLEGRPTVYRPPALLVVVVGPQHGVRAAGTLILRMNHQPGRPGEQSGRCQNQQQLDSPHRFHSVFFPNHQLLHIHTSLDCRSHRGTSHHTAIWLRQSIFVSFYQDKRKENDGNCRDAGNFKQRCHTGASCYRILLLLYINATEFFFCCKKTRRTKRTSTLSLAMCWYVVFEAQPS